MCTRPESSLPSTRPGGQTAIAPFLFIRTQDWWEKGLSTCLRKEDAVPPLFLLLPLHIQTAARHRGPLPASVWPDVVGGEKWNFRTWKFYEIQSSVFTNEVLLEHRMCICPRTTYGSLLLQWEKWAPLTEITKPELFMWLSAVKV